MIKCLKQFILWEPSSNKQNRWKANAKCNFSITCNLELSHSIFYIVCEDKVIVCKKKIMNETKKKSSNIDI